MADRSVSIALQAEVAGFVNGIRTAQRSAAGFMAELDKSAKKRAALSDLGDTAGKVGLAAAAGLGAAVVASANFDQAMSHVQAATHETASNMDALREAALKAGAQTAFSATEAAAGIEALSKAGVATQDILSGGLTGALDLAAAGGLEVGAAAEYAATALTQFGLSGAEVPHVADLLAAAAGKAQGDVSDMGAALGQVGLVANNLELSLEETTGGLAAFASAGLIGSDAGTSFKAMLQALTPNSAKAAEEMERLGISAFDSQGNFIGLAEFAGVLQTSLAGLTDEQRATTLETIYGSDAVRAASEMYRQGADGVQSWIDKVDDTGFAAETAATRVDNLRGDLEKFGGAVETALIGAGEGSQGMLRSVVQNATGVVDAFNKMPPAAQNVAGAFLGITAITGGALWFGSKVINGIANTRQSLSDLNISGEKSRTMLGRLGKAAGAAAAVFAALDLAKAFRESEGDIQRYIEMTEAIGGTTAEAKLAALNAELERQQAIIDDAVTVDYAGVFLAPFSSKAVDAKNRADALSEAIAQTEHELELAAVAGDQAGAGGKAAADGFDAAAGAAGRAADGTRSFSDSLKRLSGFLDERGMLREYQAALDDFTKSVKDNGRSFDINTEKGRSNQAALDAIARSAVEVASSMEDADRVGFLKRSAGDIRRIATEMDLPKRATQEVIDKLVELSRQNPKPKVDADTANAIAKILDADRRLRALDGNTATMTVTTQFRQIGVPFVRPQTSGVPFRASGGPVYGPGTKTSDSIPAYLSNGEYVVRAAAVERYGVGMFDQLNAMRFAAGGSVGSAARRPDEDQAAAETRAVRQRAEEHARRAERQRERHIDRLERQLERLDDQRDELRKLREDQRDFSASVVGNFRTDPFENNFTVGGVMRSLAADTQNTRAFTGDARRARRLGLSGQTLEALLASGNSAVLDRVDTRREVRQLEAAWRRRNAATQQLSGLAGNAWLDAHGTKQTQTIGELNKAIDRLNDRMRNLRQDLRRATREGSREGVREGTRRHSQHRASATQRAKLP